MVDHTKNLTAGEPKQCPPGECWGRFALKRVRRAHRDAPHHACGVTYISKKRVLFVYATLKDVPGLHTDIKSDFFERVDHEGLEILGIATYGEESDATSGFVIAADKYWIPWLRFTMSEVAKKCVRRVCEELLGPITDLTTNSTVCGKGARPAPGPDEQAGIERINP